MEVVSGYYAQISQEQIISAVKMRLKIESSDQDIWFASLVNEGALQFNTTSTLIKRQCALVINNNKTKIPKDFNKLLGLRFVSNSSSSTDTSTSQMQPCTPFVYVDMDFLNTCGCSTNSPWVTNMKGTFQINGNHLIFYGDLVDGTEVSVAYMATNVDSDGLRIIYERYERALVSYLCWNYTLQNFQEYNQYIITKWERQWVAQKRMIRSLDAKESFNNMKAQIREVANAMIIDKPVF